MLVVRSLAKASPHLLASGVALASAMTFVRVGIVVAVLNATLLSLVVPTLAVATVTALAIAALAAHNAFSTWRFSN